VKEKLVGPRLRGVKDIDGRSGRSWRNLGFADLCAAQGAEKGL